MKNLLKEMENKFIVDDRDDSVFISKFIELEENKDLVRDIEKDQNLTVEYEDMSMYWYGVGIFNIIVNGKVYEIILKYGYPQDGELHDGDGELPTIPTIEVKCKEFIKVA